MGKFSYFNFNSYSKFKLGWVSHIEVKKSGRYTIKPQTSNANIFLSLSQKNTGDEYFFDYRIKVGFDSCTKAGNGYVHCDDPDPYRGVGLLIRSSNNWKYDDSGLKFFKKDETFRILNKDNSAYKNNPLDMSLYDAGIGVFSDGSVFSDYDNKFKFIQIKHDSFGADVFVRFDPTYSLKAVGSAGQIKLDWSAVDLAGGYEIYRDATSTKPIYTGKDLTYTDKNVSNGVTYKYYLRAYDSFTELPGKTYPMQFSDPVSASPTNTSPYFNLAVCYEGSVGDASKYARFGYLATDLKGVVSKNSITSGITPTGIDVGKNSSRVWSTNNYALTSSNITWTVSIDGLTKTSAIAPSGSANAVVTASNRCQGL